MSDWNGIIQRQGEESRMRNHERIEALARAMPEYLSRISTMPSIELLDIYSQWCGEYQSHWRERKLMQKLRRVAKTEIARRMLP